MLTHIPSLIKGCLWRLHTDERGVTIPEYAIMLALVAIAVALAAPGITDAIVGVFDQAIDAMSVVAPA